MSKHTNPFVLPGFGQSGEFAGNPVMASMEMMRQAWQSLAEQGGFSAPSMAVPLSEADLTQRIADLRAVENWLRMHLTVLSSTIQGLEVQRATVSTLKSFVHNASAATGQDAAPLFDADQAVAATQTWWDMLRQQFDHLAKATAASMPPETSETFSTATGTAPARTASASSRKAAASSKARKATTPANPAVRASRRRST